MSACLQSILPSTLASGLSVLVAIGGMPSLAAAQQPDDSIRAAALRDYHGPDREGKDGPLVKAGLDLVLIYHEYQAYREERSGEQGFRGDRGQEGEGFSSSVAGVRTTGGHVTIDAIATGEPETLRSALEELGLKNAATAGQIVSGRLPIDQIPALAKLEPLRSASPSRMQTQQGPTPPPGDAAQSPRADPDTAAAEEAPAEAANGTFGTGALLGALAVIAGLLGFLFWR